MGAVFLVSGFFLLRDLGRSRREREANRQLAIQVQEAEEAASGAKGQGEEEGAAALEYAEHQEQMLRRVGN